MQQLDVAYWYTPDDGITYPYRGKGLRIPTLIEFLTTFADTSVLFNIEIKVYFQLTAKITLKGHAR